MRGAQHRLQVPQLRLKRRKVVAARVFLAGIAVRLLHIRGGQDARLPRLREEHIQEFRAVGRRLQLPDDGRDIRLLTDRGGRRLILAG